MRDPQRIDDILELIGEIWRQAPDLRLGQLLVNAARPSSPVPEVFYIEDDKLVEGLHEFAKTMREARDGEDG